MKELDNLVKINQLKSEAADARNLAEYEGHLDVNSQLLKELISITQELQALVKALPAINN